MAGPVRKREYKQWFDHTAEKQRTDLAAVNPVKRGLYGALDFAKFLKTEALPPDDPDEDLTVQGDDEDFWTDNFKRIVLEKIDEQRVPQFLRPHFDPGDILKYLPLYDEPWQAKHKALAILCLRILVGKDWGRRMKWWEDFYEPEYSESCETGSPSDHPPLG